MENFKEIINIIVNSKVGVVVATAVSVILVLAFVFSKTSIGRKALNELRDASVTTRSLVDTHRENVENQQKKEKEKVDNELKAITEAVECERQEFFEVVGFIKNAKVQQFIQDHKNMSVKELISKYKKDALKGE